MKIFSRSVPKLVTKLSMLVESFEKEFGKKISLSERKRKLRLVHRLPVVYPPAVYDDGESG